MTTLEASRHRVRLLNKIERLQRWIDENPGKFDGVTEKLRLIRDYETALGLLDISEEE